jgi:hypothetical protein
MPALPRRAAADALGISPATLLRWTRDGTGKITSGGGRGRRTLYDVPTIAAARGLCASAPSAETIGQLERGAKALSLAQIIIADLAMLVRTGALAQFDVPAHRRAELIRFLALRVIDTAHEHLKISERPSFAQLTEITGSR